MPARLNDLLALVAATAVAVGMYVLVVWLILDVPFFGGELPVRLIASALVAPIYVYAIAKVARRAMHRELSRPRLGV